MKFPKTVGSIGIGAFMFGGLLASGAWAEIYPPNPFSNRLERIGTSSGSTGRADGDMPAAGPVGAVSIAIVGVVSTSKRTLVTFDLGGGRLFTAERGQEINGEYRLLGIDDTHARIERLSDEVQLEIEIFGSAAN